MMCLKLKSNLSVTSSRLKIFLPLTPRILLNLYLSTLIRKTIRKTTRKLMRNKKDHSWTHSRYLINLRSIQRRARINPPTHTNQVNHHLKNHINQVLTNPQVGTNQALTNPHRVKINQVHTNHQVKINTLANRNQAHINLQDLQSIKVPTTNPHPLDTNQVPHQSTSPLKISIGTVTGSHSKGKRRKMSRMREGLQFLTSAKSWPCFQT